MNNKQKSVFITIVGVPNVGKSSILNRLLGRKIAIVSSKPQTTRNAVRGIYTRMEGGEPACQFVFIDTPGIHKPKNKLGSYMTDTAIGTLKEVDAVLMAKNIDGVYTADPAKDPSATLIKDISYAEALRQGLKVMDASAFALCAENRVPTVRVFGLDDPENLIRVLEGDPMGTFVHP